MIATAEMENARACGIAALDEAERDILSARPRAAIAPEGDRLALSRKLRLEFARECHVSTKGRPLDFSEPWLWPIYDDDSEVKVLMKSVQCGISEFNIITTLADAAAGRVVLYVLPTFDVRNRFVDQRVNRAMLLVPRYQQMMYEAIGNVDNKGFKNFGPGSIYFVSADTERSFVEIAAETLIVDEVDKCDQDNLVMAPDRLEGTDKRFRRRIDVGNPTHNEFGISARFLESDQREWQVKCRACATWQTLDFFANVLRVERDDKGEIRRYELRDAAWQKHLDRDIGCYCVKCGAALDRLERDGKFCGWHAMNPGHAITGWHISKLMAARSQVRDIYLAWCGADGDPSETARVFNSLLGLSYSPAGSTLTDDLLNGCAKDFDLAQNAEGPCTMGIDVGRTWDVRISDAPEPGIRRARLIGRFNGPEPCLDLIKRFHVTSCVIDARPETRLAIEFQKMAAQRRLALRLRRRGIHPGAEEGREGRHGPRGPDRPARRGDERHPQPPQLAPARGRQADPGRVLQADEGAEARPNRKSERRAVHLDEGG
jgi:hypothetical protein